MHRYRICSRFHKNQVFGTKMRCTGIAFADFGLRSDAQAWHLLIVRNKLIYLNKMPISAPLNKLVILIEEADIISNDLKQ